MPLYVLKVILLQDCAKHGWPNYQFADATGAAYQNLYRNKNGNLLTLLFHLICINHNDIVRILGLRDSFAAFWAKVAQEFVGNPYIIGYELLNEPWAGMVQITTKNCQMTTSSLFIKEIFMRIPCYCCRRLLTGKT